MAAERRQEFAELPREGESWQQMIERQKLEQTNKGGYSRELFRSLPVDQQQEKEGGNLGNVSTSLQAADWQTYEAMLHEAAQHAGPEQDHEIER